YYGLINNICREMKPEDFSGILTRGGTILGTKRQPFKMMTVIGEDKVDKVKNMKQTYKTQKLDCLLTLGGNGTHKTSKLLSDEGLNVIGLPKTIDNDIYGTDVTFGFHTAVDIATDAIDRLHSTANSHSRILLCEIMGNKAGWLTLYAGISGGADIILIPEIPYNIDKVCESVVKRSESGKNFSIIAVAEGCFDTAEAKLKKKERARLRQEAGIVTATNRIASQIQKNTGLEARVCVPGHMLRGGNPSAYDRLLATQFGEYAAQLIRDERYGMTVAKCEGRITANKLEDIAGKTKFVAPDCQIVTTAKNIGISFGD
ncbi:MAG: 6-phosphofructokinase, partial [Ruminococcus sp.]